MVAEVAGSLIWPVIKLVIDKAKSCAADRVRWLHGGVPEGLERLEDTLTQLRTVAVAVERRDVKDSSDLARWLRQFKDAVYEADDILDGFAYQALQPDAGKATRLGSSFVKFSKKIVGTDEHLSRLKDVLKKLDSINSNSERLMCAAGLKLSASTPTSHHHFFDDRVTGSMPEDEQVFGRDKELKQMVSWLIAVPAPDAAARRAAVDTAAIMGHGGMGKTTLARLLCHDEEVKKRFHLVMWVCPAATTDKVELVKMILQSAGVEVTDGMKSFDLLQRSLEGVVSSQKFLLVLDNVWNKEGTDEYCNREMWSDVLAPLRCGEAGSKILVTTRRKIVADMLNASKRIWLNGLLFDDVWLLFKKCAFHSDDIDKFLALQAIGKKIVAKLNGLPLAAKVVGWMLEGSRSVSQWNKVLEMEIYDDVISTLELCYQNLPEHLQLCFAICSIFPKNWRFKRDKLVKIWMALDFITPADGKNQLEDVGREYFDQLVARSFFHVHKEGRRSYYYINDLMHDLAEKVSRFDCARVEGVKTEEIPKTIRHLSVTSDSVAQLKDQCELKRLRTFLILKHPSSSLDQLPDDLLTELRGLRVLGLDGCSMVNLSEKIGLLIHLRYLAICKTITTLPQSVCKLFHLQTLSFPKRCRLEALPKDMANLTRLRHLDMDRTSTSKVVGIGKLVHLQGSIEFHVKKEKGHTLEDLNDMNDLRRKLHIKNLDVVGSREEACKAGLSKKRNVKVLELEWNSTAKSIPSVDAEVLEGLEPHPNIEELHIRRYHGNMSPRWLNTSLKEREVHFLKSLYLTNCRKLEVLPPLGQLPCLKVLHMKEMCSLKQISSEFYGTDSVAFPYLVDLKFDDMPQWVQWTKEENINAFPNLGKLKLLNCPGLIKVPSFPPSIRKVTVERTKCISHLKLSSSSSSSSTTTRTCCFALEACTTAILQDGLLHRQQVEAIDVLTVRDCQDIKFEELQALSSLRRLHICHSAITVEQLCGCLRGLQSLSSLEIVNCNNVTSLPRIEGLNSLTKFRELHIQQCPRLSSLHSLPSFVALESLVIQNCASLTVESFPANFKSLNSLRKLSILYCAELESLPSGFPSSLQVLHLIGCKPTLSNQLQQKNGEEWDKVACILTKQIN